MLLCQDLSPCFSGLFLSVEDAEMVLCQASEYPAGLFSQFMCMWEASPKSCLSCILTTIELWSNYFFLILLVILVAFVSTARRTDQLSVSPSSGM